MDEYTKRIIHYMNNQKYNYLLDTYSHKVEYKSLFCGDFCTLYFEIDDGIIEDVSYQHSGCSLNIFALEIFCEILKGEPVQKIGEISPKTLREKIEFPIIKSHCVELAIDCFNELLVALEDESL